MAVPTKDSSLVTFGQNVSTRITAAPADFALLAADATQYAALLAPYLAAYAAMKEARDAGNRSKSLTAARTTAKELFLAYARYIYDRVQANPNVTNANKELLGITIRALPTPQPPPLYAPAVDVRDVVGHAVSVRLHDSEHPTRKGRPLGVKGAAVFSYVGDAPPTDPAQLHFEGNTSKTEFTINFPLTVPQGATVYVCAMWFNATAQSGPTSIPVATNIQFGGALAV